MNGSGEADRIAAVAAEVQIGGVERRVAGPQPPVERPRVAGERRRQPAGQVRLVDVAAGDEPANRFDTALVPRAVEARGEVGRQGDVVRASGRRRSREHPFADLRQPSITSPGVAVQRPAPDPGRARPPVPCDHPVVEPKPEEGQALVVGRDRWQALQRVAQVVGEVADEPAEERRRVRVGDACGLRRIRRQPCDESPGIGERILCGGRGFKHGDRVGRQVRPPSATTRPRRLEQGKSRQAAERFRGVDRPDGRELRERLQPDRRASANPGGGAGSGTGAPGVDHRAMIGGILRRGGEEARCEPGISAS